MDEWSQILAEVRPALPEREFEAWFQPTAFGRLDNGILYVLVPSQLHCSRIIHRYTELVVHAVRSLNLGVSKIVLMQNFESGTVKPTLPFTKE